MPNLAKRVGAPNIILDRILRDEVRASVRKRACTDLWWLMTEVGELETVPNLITAADGFKLSESFHKPHLDQWDRNRRAWRNGTGLDQLDLWSREFGKTTCLLWATIQDYLWDPRCTEVWWHAVEEKAEDACYWISTQLQKNKKVRKLFEPGVLPSEKAKRFISGSEFTLPSNYHGHAPSFRAYGWTSEATGAHAKIGKLDDIVARNIIEDNQQIKQNRWFQNTVCNVVEARGRKMAVGTRWAMDDQYSSWLKSPYWTCVTRSALEKDGVPDKNGKPTFMDMKLIQKKMDEMGMDFDPQMMNDPSPEGEKPWPGRRESEMVIPATDAKGQGLVVVLSDPAPAKIGSAVPKSRREIYADGQKDYWANAVVKLRKRGQRNEVILLDGSVSRDWDDQQGFDEVCRLQRKWGTPRSVVEKVGSVAALYERAHRDAARRTGVRYSPIELESVYRGKNHLFGALCSRATQDEFLICEETCDRQFLEMFMDQARNWRVMQSGNGLRFDDCANVVSFACDPALARMVPVVMPVEEWSPYKEKEVEDEAASRTRYVRW